MEARIADEKYLRQHPELPALIQAASQQLMEQRPEDPVRFLASYFARPDLRDEVRKHSTTR